MIVNPWGKVSAQADDVESLRIEGINLSTADEMRQRVQVFGYKHSDVYGK